MRVAALLVVAALAVWTGPAASEEPNVPVGEAAAVEGTVRVHRDAFSGPMQPGADIFAQDRIVTGADGKVRLVMADGAEIAVGADTELVVARYVVEGGGRADALWDLVRGLLRATLPQTGTPGPFEVETGVAVASARSTEFTVESLPAEAKTSVFVFEGAVEVAPADFSGVALLSPGFGIDLVAGQPLPDVVQWGRSRVESVVERTTVR